jgi:single-strand DNA-binding protein
VSRQWNDSNGQPQEETEWINVIAWGKLAEIAGEYVTKGRRVYVEGRLHTSTWQDENGEKRSRTEVVAGEILLLDRRHDRAGDHDEDIDDRADHQPQPRQQRKQRPQQQRRGHAAPRTSKGNIDWEAAGL